MPRNNSPRRKHERRIRAAERLAKQMLAVERGDAGVRLPRRCDPSKAAGLQAMDDELNNLNDKIVAGISRFGGAM